MSWLDSYTGGEAMGGAASGAATGTMVAPGIGTAIGAGLGLLLGGAQASSKKKKQKVESELAATQTALSPWLSGKQGEISVGPDAQAQGSPWMGLSALAKSYSEMKNMQNQEALIKALTQPRAGYSPSRYDVNGNIMAGKETLY